MSAPLTIRAFRQAFDDRVFGACEPKLEIHPDSRKSMGKWARKTLGVESTPNGEVIFFMGVEVRDNPDVPPGQLRVDAELPPADFDLPEAE